MEEGRGEREEGGGECQWPPVIVFSITERQSVTTNNPFFFLIFIINVNLI